MNVEVSLHVNGEVHVLNARPGMSLNTLLRKNLGLTGTKRGCDYGGCGCCTVLLEGKAVYSCMVFAAKANGKRVTTIEGLQRGEVLDPVQEAFIKGGAIQCGFCTPGIIMSARALLDSELNPTKEQIAKAIAGNLCRCTGYYNIIEAIKKCALIGEMRSDTRQ